MSSSSAPSSSSPSSSSPSVPYVSFAELAKQVWWYPVARGLLAIVLGIIVMTNPKAVGSFLVTVVGIFVLVDGVVGVVDGIRRRGAPEGGASWRLATGVLGVLVGAALVFWTGATVAFMSIIVGSWAVVAGILAVVAGFGVRSVPGSGWGWGVLWGTLTFAFGVALIASPHETVAAVFWLIGLYAVLSGIVLVIAGFVIRSLGKRAAAQGM